MATIKDVAKLAGVSLGTVSNIINGSRTVSLEKIVKVEKAMKELGYMPNNFARGLKSTNTQSIAVILPNVIDYAMSQLFSSIASAMRDRGYSVSLSITNEIAEIETKYIKNAIMSHVDGIVLVTCQPEKTGFFKEIIDNGVKIVFALRMVKELDANFVGFDVSNIMKAFIRYQKEEGTKNICLLSCSKNFTYDAHCAEKFIEYGKKYLGKDLSENVYSTNYSKESALKEAVLCLEGEKETTAVLCTNSLISIGAYKALEILNMSNTKVYAFDAMTWSNKQVTNVKKIEMPYIELGEAIANLLYQSLCNPVFAENTQKYLSVKTADWNIENYSNIHVDNKNKTLRVLMLKNGNVVPSYALFSEFERDTGITVEICMKSYQELYNEIIKSHEEGRYDIYEVDLPWMSYLASRGMITELHEIDEECEQYLGDIVEEIIPEYTQYNGGMYAFPYMYCSQLLFYRKDLFEDIKYKRMFHDMYKTELQPPKNWREYNAVARFFTKEFNPESKTLYGTTAGGCVDNGAVCEFLPRYWSYGGEIVKNGKPCLDENAAVKALQNYKESFRFAPKGSEELWWDEQCATFCNGDAAMMILFNAHAADVVNRKKSKVAGRVGFDIIPGQVSMIGGWSLAIDSKSSLKSEALQFMKWTCSERFSVVNTILGGCSPSKKIYNDTEISGIYPWHRTMLDVYQYAKARNFPGSDSGKSIEYRKVELKIGELVHQALTDTIEIEEAVKRLKEYLEKIYIRK